MVKLEFFSEATKVRQEQKLVHEEMPFLYGILIGMVRNNKEPPSTDADSLTPSTGPNDLVGIPTKTFEAQVLEREGLTYVSNSAGGNKVSC